MIGIRREDKNAWERRVALTPEHVAKLVRDGVPLCVETSEHRAYPDRDYGTAGVEVGDSTDGARVVLGIKEIKLKRLAADTTYLFFSHTTKGQSHNMPMLQRLLDLRCTLLDYEQITDDQGRRLIFFGLHAGYAGMIDALWALGERLALDGFDTVLRAIKPAHRYTTLDEALDHIESVGRKLAEEGLPEGIDPVVIGFTGTGNVSIGAQKVLDRLPVVELTPQEMLDGRQSRRDVVYKTVLDLDERYRNVNGGKVEIAELGSNPERFENATLPYLKGMTVLVNGMFWVPALPRLLTNEDLRNGWKSGELSGMKIIADIACDIDGAIEATYKATTPENPVFVYDVAKERYVDGFKGDGPVILSVDNLPAELPRESSQHFGDTLLQFIPALDNCDWDVPVEELALPPELTRAIITHRGQLTPSFAYLEEALAADGGDA